MMRLKERINQAFATIIKLHESTIDRDAVIVESLVATQLGKLNRLIVKKQIHDNLKVFNDELNEPFEPPEILLTLKPEAAWRQIATNETTMGSTSLKVGNGGFRKSKTRKGTRNNSIKKQKFSQHRRSSSRSTNGSQRSRVSRGSTRGGTQKLMT